MRTPKEILELQEQSIARSKKALAQVNDDRLIAWNSSRLLQNALMAWLMAKRHDLNFTIEELLSSVTIFEENIAAISEKTESNYTYYLLACMICNKKPESQILEFAKSQANDIEFLLNSSVVPYVHYGLVSSDEVSTALENRSKNLSVESAVVYLKLLSLDSNPDNELIDALSALFHRRKKDSFYSEARIYGGGLDNDMVCDVEFAAICSTKGSGSVVVPAVNKSLHRTGR